MQRKTGKYRLAPKGDCVCLQIEMYGIFRPDQLASGTKWVWATPQDLADLVTVEIKTGSVSVAA